MVEVIGDEDISYVSTSTQEQETKSYGEPSCSFSNKPPTKPQTKIEYHAYADLFDDEDYDPDLCCNQRKS